MPGAISPIWHFTHVKFEKEASMTRRHYAARNAAMSLMACSFLTTLMLPAFGQQHPLTVATGERFRYPDGANLQAQYEIRNEAMVLPPARSTMRSASAGLAAAATIQARLPDGYSLLAGATSHLPPSQPSSLATIS